MADDQGLPQRPKHSRQERDEYTRFALSYAGALAQANAGLRATDTQGQTLLVPPPSLQNFSTEIIPSSSVHPVSSLPLDLPNAPQVADSMPIGDVVINQVADTMPTSGAELANPVAESRDADPQQAGGTPPSSNMIINALSVQNQWLNVEAPDDEPPSPYLSGLGRPAQGSSFVSLPLRKRIRAVISQDSKKIFMDAKKLVTLKATLHQFLTFKDQEKIPKSLLIDLPVAKLQALNLSLQPEETTLAAARALSQDLFNKLIEQTQSATAKAESEFISSLPMHDEEHFNIFRSKVLYSADSSIEQEIPLFDTLLHQTKKDFNFELRQGFALWLYECRLTASKAFYIMGKRKFVVKNFLQRHEMQEGSEKDDEEPESSDTQLRNQVSTLQKELQEMRQTMTSLRQQLHNQQRPSSRGRSRTRRNSNTPRSSSRNGSRSQSFQGQRSKNGQTRRVQFSKSPSKSKSKKKTQKKKKKKTQRTSKANSSMRTRSKTPAPR